MRIIFEGCILRNLLVIIVLSLFVCLPDSGIAAPPVLNFSDIDSGPKTGNTDGVGSGAIVTIWGNNLGSTQSTSAVYVGGVQATAIYYWKDADGNLPGGPADLKTYHKMQEIAFAVPAGAVDGANTIKVTVDGVTSNTLPFTVRTGNIRFVKAGGADSGAGTWSSPWLTPNYAASGSSAAVAGDIIYFVGVASTTGLKIGGNSGLAGTASTPFSFITYPNTTASMSGAPGGSESTVVMPWYNEARHTTGINLSKLSITAAGNGGGIGGAPNGVMTSQDCRYVGLAITGPTVYGGYGGAVTNTTYGTQGGVFLGLYIHHYGYPTGWEYNSNLNLWTSPPYDGIAGVGCTNCTTVDRYQHLFYISNRAGYRVNAYEIGWGHFTDNPILEGIHIYDQAPGGGWTGTIKAHHNVIKNQRGGAIDIDYPDTTPVEVYNNIIISDTNTPYSGEAFKIANTNNSNIKVYNNTVYGYNTISSNIGSLVDFRNNIMVDTRGVTFFSTTPTYQSNNLFYSTGSTAKPSWATALTGNLNVNPLFINPANYDFRLSASSPATVAGSDVVIATAPTDFFGQPRLAGSVSIGAINYTSAIPAPAAPKNFRIIP